VKKKSSAFGSAILCFPCIFDYGFGAGFIRRNIAAWFLHACMALIVKKRRLKAIYRILGGVDSGFLPHNF
jgi:hypothetical protein